MHIKATGKFTLGMNAEVLFPKERIEKDLEFIHECCFYIYQKSCNIYLELFQENDKLRYKMYIRQYNHSSPLIGSLYASCSLTELMEIYTKYILEELKIYNEKSLKDIDVKIKSYEKAIEDLKNKKELMTKQLMIY